MIRQKPLVILVIIKFSLLTILSCGIEELYYLPQIPESQIVQTMIDAAEINIPSNLLNNVDHYATGYIIFYKIYISSSNNNSIIDILNNNSRILYDYNALLPYTDPANATTITSLTTFSSRGYYELELEGVNIRNTVLSKNGGRFSIQFPLTHGEKPIIVFGNKYPLYRSNGGGTFTPKPDRYFFSSPELNDYTNAVSTINADVSGLSGVSDYAYASMYIVAVGQNPSTFQRLYGKPTHINIFRLTPVN
jgi:hypothetical protein